MHQNVIRYGTRGGQKTNTSKKLLDNGYIRYFGR